MPDYIARRRISRARHKYLQENPFDPDRRSVPAVNAAGEPSGVMTFPDLGELGILGCKLGMEYLAVAHDEDAVEDWIQDCVSLAKSPEVVGLLFANVFRGMNTLLGSIFADRGLQPKMESIAVEAWEKNFDGGAA
ncbi:hypothetical protein [uncultured Gordonia sp.]|uniref:hypothetical protein n=1 Tax=uncultured Gordonia sp. TaxID=198437 RepID=UPI002588BFBF|nr:hypothetical protein [uncultured Gordonia sp.]